MSVSHWVRPQRPGVIARRGVVVVGAGVVGLGACEALARRGESPLLLDRAGPGAGASTRNAGFLMRGAADNYADAVDAWGRDLARTVWRWTEENIGILRGLGVESLPSYRRVPSCLLAMTAEESDALGRAAAMLGEDGFDVETLESGDDAVWRSGAVRRGLLNPNDGSVNPAELIAMLAERSPAEIRRDHAVYAMERDAGSGGVLVRTTGGDVMAERVLVCANAFTPALLPELEGVIVGNRGQMLALREGAPGDTRVDFSYYLNNGSEYLRRASEDTIVLGGWRRHFEAEERTLEDRVTPGVQGGLEAFAERVLGRRLDVVSRWSGVMGFTPDGLPLVGPVGGDDRVVVCAGFHGHGMSLGVRTARAAVECLLDGAPPPFPAGRFAGSTA